METIKLFGRNVQRYRMALGISQEAFAQRCEMDRSYMGEVEQGKANITLKRVDVIANALGIHVGALFEEDENLPEVQAASKRNSRPKKGFAIIRTVTYDCLDLVS